jgi:hypothetical protein
VDKKVLNLWKHLAVLSAKMNETIPAAADQSKSIVDLDQIRAAAQFGNLGFEAYVAAVKAESERLFKARMERK